MRSFARSSLIKDRDVPAVRHARSSPLRASIEQKVDRQRHPADINDPPRPATGSLADGADLPRQRGDAVDGHPGVRIEAPVSSALGALSLFGEPETL
jgi:hypothetical protein